MGNEPGVDRGLDERTATHRIYASTASWSFLVGSRRDATTPHDAETRLDARHDAENL